MLRLVHGRVTRYSGVALIILALAMTGILASCGGAAPGMAVIPELEFTSSEFSFTIPQNIPSGLVMVHFVNTGKEPHEFSFLQLNQGVTVEKYRAELQKAPPASFSMIKWHGGVATVMPGGSGTAIVRLDPGQYVAVCFVNSPPDATPHFIEGMYQPFTVTPATGPVLQDPQADLDVSIHDFTYTIPALKTGHELLKISNNDKVAHELNILKLNDGKTMADAKAFVKEKKGPPPLDTAKFGQAPFTYAGGLQPIEPGMSAWLQLNLEPGTYVALCFVPDPSTDKSHVDMGMMVQFTVS